MSELRTVLMKRDKLTHEEADEIIREARMQVSEGEDPEEILADEFGLEPDYIFDLI